MDKLGLNRIVALLTPVFAGLAGSLADWLAQNVPGGPQLDKSELTAVFVAGAVTALGAAYKWLDGWQKHETVVADVKAEALARQHEKELASS